MKLPNVYVAPKQEMAIELSRFFVGGEKKEYICDINNKSVATVVVSGTKLIVTGVSEGFALLTVTVDGTEYIVNITVRNGAADNGWM